MLLSGQDNHATLRLARSCHGMLPYYMCPTAGGVHSVVESLLLFLECLDTPIILDAYYDQCLQACHNYTLCKQVRPCLPHCSHYSLYTLLVVTQSLHCTVYSEPSA